MTDLFDENVDRLYSPSKWSHRFGPDEAVAWHIDQCNKVSQESQDTLGIESSISYGDTPKQKIDIFHKKDSPTEGSPIFVYIHGGYWHIQELHRQNSSFPAVTLCQAGATLIVVGYDLAPAVTLATIVNQMEKAVELILKIAKERKSSGVYLCGHCAGAHLALMMLRTSFSGSEMIKGAVLVSGVFDVRPLRQTSQNSCLNLSEEEATSLSPSLLLKEITTQSSHCHVVVTVGEHESPEFHRQSVELEKNLRDLGVKTTYLDAPDADHFSVMNNISDPNNSLTKECIRLMGL